MHASFFATVCLAVLFLFFPGVSAQAASKESLTPRQQELWDATLKKLNAVYAQKGLIPNPMSAEEVAAIQVPLVCDGSKTGPLPWDVRVLLRFDRNLSIGFGKQEKLFERLLDPKQRVFIPEGLPNLLWEISSFLGDEESMDRKATQKAFLEKGAKLPVILALAQLGGDEVPGLWLASGSPCTPVIHFDYDDMPEFYLRSLCLLEYVAWYIDAEGNPESLNDNGTDQTFLLTPAETASALKTLPPQLEPLNEALDDSLMATFPE